MARRLRGAPGEGLEAVAEARHEVLVVEALRDHHVDHGERQRRIRANARGEPQVGHLRRLGALGVDDDDTGAALLGGLEGSPFHGIGDRGVAADNEGTARVVDVLPARDVEAHGTRADGPATAAQVLVDHPVGRADRAHREGEDDAAREVGAAGGADDGLRPMLAPHLGQAVGHLVERLVPGDARPLALAARSGAAHWVEQAVLVIGDAGRTADALDAEGALGVRVLAVGLKVHHLALAHGGERAATGGAFPAGRWVHAVCGPRAAGKCGAGHGLLRRSNSPSLRRGW